MRLEATVVLRRIQGSKACLGLESEYTGRGKAEYWGTAFLTILTRQVWRNSAEAIEGQG